MKRHHLGMLSISFLILIVSYIIYDGWITIFPSACQIHAQGKDFLMSPQCLLQHTLPKLTLAEVVDELWDDISGFDQMYQTHNPDYTSTGSSARYSKPIPDLRPATPKALLQLKQAQQAGEQIRITRKQVAQQYFTQLHFFVADKDISQLRPCTKTNYELALTSVDHLLLGANEVFNYNNHLQDLRGYCSGLSGDARLFYGGVCGVSSQLFRVALITPDIGILQRQPHNERFTVYYGQQVQGDDAAVIDMRKQFEIRNTAKSPMYFRTKKIGNTTYLAAILWGHDTRAVRISKHYSGDLEVALTRSIIQYIWNPKKTALPAVHKGSTTLRQETYSSKYIAKNNENR